MAEPDPRVERLSGTKRELLSRWLAGSPAAAAPETGAERTVAAIWREVLDLGEVGRDDDYFALGGDSVHAIVIVAKLEEAGLRITAQDLFDLATVRGVAERAVLGAVPSVPPGPSRTEHPLGPMQEGMLYHSAGGSGPGAYVVQVCCSLTGELDPAAFRAAWAAVLAATPALRASFGWAGRAEPHQVVAATAEPDVEFLDWRDRGVPERAEALAEYLDRDRERGFDLGRAPLFRLALMRESATGWRCVWTHHHLILDGWSQQLVLADVLASYAALQTGAEPRLPRRPAMPDYLDWLRPRDAAADLAFWGRQFAGLPGPSRIAGPGCVRGQVLAPRRGEVAVTVPESATAALNSLCRGHGLTVSTVLYGVWGLLLGELCASADVVFGVTVSGRPPSLPGATELVGMLINTLPLRVRCTGEAAVLPWLRELRDRLAGMREHGHLPLSRITRAIGLNRGETLFDTIVVIENFPVAVTGGTSGALAIGDVRTLVDEGYPLVLEAVPGAEIRLRARHDPSRLTAAEVRGMLDACTGCLDALVADPAQPVSRLRARLAERHRLSREQEFLDRRDSAGQQLRTARRRGAADIGGTHAGEGS
ncbi:condensation domain-containing protein [Amycolatopsis rubida]|uniref:Nonribosomal peptide synthetase protein BlmV n=1 Tax=Amycolatopsis rubida TaxID=112413 RepID=A0A1I6AJ75_9PSEU|nr:condensation domain-containing protein [Amycolatopsis rubida]SFQ68557.1 nonribosomal peptide synthetase protein BlmV [Amycolatopsis rubida]